MSLSMDTRMSLSMDVLETLTSLVCFAPLFHKILFKGYFLLI